jgi:hypothetical protein
MHMSKKLRQTKLRRAHAKTQMHDQARATTSDKQSQISVATSIWCSSPVIITSMIVSYPEAIDIDATTPLCLVASTTGSPPIGKEQASTNLQPLQSCPTNAFLRQLYSPTRSTLSCVAYLPAQAHLGPPIGAKGHRHGPANLACQPPVHDHPLPSRPTEVMRRKTAKVVLV